jgi:hypothetical protein
MKTTAIVMGILLGIGGLTASAILIYRRQTSISPWTFGLLGIAGLMSSGLILAGSVAAIAVE